VGVFGALAKEVLVAVLLHHVDARGKMGAISCEKTVIVD
jgi:hypothetical protein